MSASERVAALLADARTRLAGVPRESLGVVREPRRLLGIPRGIRIVPDGDAWHLGALLLTDDGVLETGEILRARESAPRGFTAETQRERAERAGAAFRGGYPEGAVVHVGWHPIDLAALDRDGAAGPLSILDGEPAVRWSRAAAPAPLARYLDERVALAAEPPAGA
jgi:hypothetical protein